MRKRSKDAAPEIREVLLESYAVNDRMNQLILEHLDPRAWRAKPDGRNARTIAAIFSHMHNMRRKWLRLSAPHIKLPGQLDRARPCALGRGARLRCPVQRAGRCGREMRVIKLRAARRGA